VNAERPRMSGLVDGDGHRAWHQVVPSYLILLHVIGKLRTGHPPYLESVLVGDGADAVVPPAILIDLARCRSARWSRPCDHGELI
jgi:hypothetical protein